MSMTAGHPSKPTKPRCYLCKVSGPTHPYPKEGASEHQLRGEVMGGYDWLCSDCAYEREYGPAVRVAGPTRLSLRTTPPQRERLFDVA